MPKRQPSRIKVGLSRPMTYSEKKYFRDQISAHKFQSEVDDSGTSSMILRWQPWQRAWLCDFRDFWARLSKNEQVYAESDTLTAEHLFDQVRDLLEEYYVNLHPTAVKTLRELG